MKGWASVDTQNGVTGMTSVWGAGVDVVLLKEWVDARSVLWESGSTLKL